MPDKIKLQNLSDGAKEWLIQHVANALGCHEGEKPTPAVLKELDDLELICPSRADGPWNVTRLADDTWDEICSLLEERLNMPASAA